MDLTVYKYSKLRASGIVALHVKWISSGYLNWSYALFYPNSDNRVNWIETQGRIWSDLLEFTVPLYSNLKKNIEICTKTSSMSKAYKSAR